MKSNKFSFLKFLSVLEIIAIIVAVGISFYTFTVVKDKNRYISEYEDKTSFYNDSNYDLLVSGASKTQIDEFKEKTFIDNVVSMKRISLSLDINGNSDYKDMLIFDDLSSLEYSEFSSERLISSLDAKNYIFVDYKFCKINNVKLGDKVTISLNNNKTEYIISRVYRTNYLYTDGLIITTSDQVSFDTKSYYAYIKTNNKEKLITYLKDFKPLGTLLEKTSYQTDEDYQNYLNSFYAKEYYSSCVIDLSESSENTISSLTSKVNETNKSYYICIVIITLLCLITSLISFFAFAKNKNDKIYKYIHENGNKKIIKLYTIFNSTFILFVICGILIFFKCSLSDLSTYYTYAKVISSSYLTLICPIVSIFLGYAVTIITIKKA